MKSLCSRTVFLATAALAWVLGTTSATTAGVLYGVTGAGNAASSLYTIDTTTGAATVIGATGFSHVTGLAFNPVTGTLYGHVSDVFDSGATQLITIDPATGAGAVVGTSGIQSPDMSFNASDALFAWGECTAAGPCDNSDDLYTIDLGTGAATLVGESGLGTASTGLAFDSGGTLYLKSGNDIRTLDPATGLPTSASSTLSEFLVNALAFDENDVPFSVDRTGGRPSSIRSI